MREMKDSGIEWIGEIPLGWTVGRIKYNYYLKGRIGWQGLKADEFIEEGPYLVTGTDFCGGRINWNTCYHISEERYEEAPEIHVQINDLLITKDGTVGKVAYIDSKPEKVSLNSHLLIMRPNNREYNNRYLFWVIQSPVFERFFLASQSGTIMSSLSQEKINDFSFAMPSEPKQECIANYLDSKCSKIDEIISKQEQIIEKLKEYRLSLITEAVTKGIQNDIEMKYSGIEWIGSIPKAWSIVPLKKKLSLIVDYRGKTPEKVDQGIFLLTAKNIKNGKIDYEISKEYVKDSDYEEIMHRGKPQIGDVLFTTEAPLGQVANIDRIDVALAQRIIKFTPDNDLNSYFLKYWIMSSGFQQFLLTLSTGSTAAGIKASKLFMLPLVLPDKSEQNKIVKLLDAKCEVIDSLIKTKELEREKLIEYKKSLIYEVVTGKKEV